MTDRSLPGRRRRRSKGPALLLAALGTLASCPNGAGQHPDAPSPRNRVRPGHAPTAFSADEIRKACPAGHYRRYLVEVPGQAPIFRTLAFEEVTKDSVELSSTQVDSRGRPFGEQRRQRARWKALQAHASFPRAATTIRKATVATGGGIFEAWLYEVQSRGGLERERYWFARALAGPPVQYERHVDGKLLFRMTLLGHGRRRPGSSPSPEPESSPSPAPEPRPAPGPKSSPSPAPEPRPAPGSGPAQGSGPAPDLGRRLIRAGA